MRTIDTYEYVSALRELTEEGKEVSMIIAGSSMSPLLIHQRDMIMFRKPDRPLKRGDMVFYQRESGQYVMHRICRIRPEGYYMVGDAQQQIEGPLSESCIFGLITSIRRKDKWLGPDSLTWKFFEGPWLVLLPLRPFISKCYAVLTRLLRR